MASRRKDRIEKLRRLAKSDNPHEAASAREEADRLAAKKEPEPDAGGQAAMSYLGHFDGVPRFFQAAVVAPDTGALPGVIRIPTPLGARRR